MLKLHNLSRTYQTDDVETLALNNVNIEISEGEFVAIMGPSGCGKSTLLNTIQPDLELKTSEVSEAHNTGTHTTTFAEMFELDMGGFIIDTPGIKAFGLIDVNKEELSHFFLEMQALRNNCHFSNCVHINEPKCAVKEAVAEGEIEEFRYYNYLGMYEEDEEEMYRNKEY